MARDLGGSGHTVRTNSSPGPPWAAAYEQSCSDDIALPRRRPPSRPRPAAARRWGSRPLTGSTSPPHRSSRSPASAERRGGPALDARRPLRLPGGARPATLRLPRGGRRAIPPTRSARTVLSARTARSGPMDPSVRAARSAPCPGDAGLSTRPAGWARTVLSGPTVFSAPVDRSDRAARSALAAVCRDPHPPLQDLLEEGEPRRRRLTRKGVRQIRKPAVAGFRSGGRCPARTGDLLLVSSERPAAVYCAVP